MVDVKRGTSPDVPKNYAEAYVPALVKNQPVAVVAAFVDKAEAAQIIYKTFLLAAVALCLLTAGAFIIPAIAWYRRTREKQQADRRIQFLAHHDPLTGLANRARLIERLDSALAVLPSVGGRIAVHFIDIDRFKQVNDSLGHDAGDFLLSTVGERLNALTRIEDMVARLGGDEFVVVQTGVSDKAQAEAFAHRVATILAEPMFFKEQEIQANADHRRRNGAGRRHHPERLLKSADLALYDGKRPAAIASASSCRRWMKRCRSVSTSKKSIRQAIADNGFVLHFQPVFEMSGKTLVGFEALTRLPAKDGTLIPPATFIPIAEDMRLIDKIGAWVLHEACRTATTWPEKMTVAVNLSPSQFESGEIDQIVRTALKDSGLGATPARTGDHRDAAARQQRTHHGQLKKLKDMGVPIVMDDFGTGYSSLSYLWKFPFDKIKIDRSFMESFEKSGRNVETVVRTIIALGREMNMRVTVEGVETSKQVDFLYDADADQVQGFYFGKPVPASEIGADMLEDFRKTLPTGEQAKSECGWSRRRRRTDLASGHRA